MLAGHQPPIKSIYQSVSTGFDQSMIPNTRIFLLCTTTTLLDFIGLHLQCLRVQGVESWEAYTHPGVAEVGRREGGRLRPGPVARRMPPPTHQPSICNIRVPPLSPKPQNCPITPAPLNCKDESTHDTQMWQYHQFIGIQILIKIAFLSKMKLTYQHGRFGVKRNTLPLFD